MARLILCAVVAFILCGCSVHPLPEQVTRKSTLAIVTAIRCEARDAILEYARSPVFDNGAIGYIFDFDISEHNMVGTDFTMKSIFGGGEFNLNLSGANVDLLRDAHRRFTVVDTFGELKRADCSDEVRRSRFKYPIAGSIGLHEVIGTFMGLDQLGHSKFGTLAAPQKIGGQAATFSDELTYTTKLDSGSINPQLALNPVPGVLTLTSLSAKAKSDRTDIHKLTLAIALPEPKTTTKHGVRMAARNTTLAAPFIGGIPSKVQIHAESDPRARVLLELDRRVLLSRTIAIAP